MKGHRVIQYTSAYDDGMDFMPVQDVVEDARKTVCQDITAHSKLKIGDGYARTKHRVGHRGNLP